jgi:hypothetical protein
MTESSFSKIDEIIAAIPNDVCEGPQPEFLFNLSLRTKGIGEVVEIGTNVGKSAIALAYGQKIKDGKPITSIDIYEHPDIRKNIEMAGVSDYVKRIVCPSHKFVKTWDKSIELLWIDGDHAYVGVCHDIKKWGGFVAAGGIIALHDYPGHRGSMEVWRALRKYIFKRPYQYRVLSDREAGSIIAFQKLATQVAGSRNRNFLKERLYWLYRNVRSRLVRCAPGLANKIKKRQQPK